MLRNPKALSRRLPLAIAAALGAMMLLSSVNAEEGGKSPTNLTVAQKTLLELQLKERYNCTLDAILFAREFELAGERKLEGRIRCADQREIDFSQESENSRFMLQLCQPTIC